MITLNSEQGKLWGFTSENFEGDSYLWKLDGVVIISFVASRRTGAFGALVRAIQEDGLEVDVPTPFAHMRSILKRWGAEPRAEYTEEMPGEHVEMWRVPRLLPRPNHVAAGSC